VQAVNTRLLNLNITYGLFNQHEILELSETAKQFREKQILISVIGRLNVGKSTLMNAILGAKLVINAVGFGFNVRIINYMSLISVWNNQNLCLLHVLTVRI